MEMAASLLRNQTQVRGQKQNTQESSPQFQLTHAFQPVNSPYLVICNKSTSSLRRTGAMKSRKRAAES